jgi:hypothetical protein
MKRVKRIHLGEAMLERGSGRGWANGLSGMLIS